MKRKLIKRNKKFLSSKFKGYLGGYGSFQPMVSFTFNKDNTISNKRTHWMWFYNESFFEGLFVEHYVNEYSSLVQLSEALNEQSTPV